MRCLTLTFPMPLVSHQWLKKKLRSISIQKGRKKEKEKKKEREKENSKSKHETSLGAEPYLAHLNLIKIL